MVTSFLCYFVHFCGSLPPLRSPLLHTIFLCVHFFTFVAEAPGTHCFRSFSALSISTRRFLCQMPKKEDRMLSEEDTPHLTSPPSVFAFPCYSHHASNIPHTAWGSTEASDTVCCESPMYIEVAVGSPLGWSLYPQPVRMSHTAHRKVGGYVPPIQRDVLH